MFDLFKAFGSEAIPFQKDWPDFRMFAIRCHDKQMYDDYPYAYHLAMVECILIEHGFIEFPYQAAGWLHDIIEDTDIKLELVLHRYGPEVAALVYSVTGEGINRKERNNSIYNKLRKHPDAAAIKVADRIANMTYSRVCYHRDGATDKLNMYLKEWSDFRENVGPLMHDSHRSRMIWECLDSLVQDCQMDMKAHKEDLELGKEVKEVEKKRENSEEPPASE